MSDSSAIAGRSAAKAVEGADTERTEAGGLRAQVAADLSEMAGRSAAQACQVVDATSTAEVLGPLLGVIGSATVLRDTAVETYIRLTEAGEEW